jgi:hypothetical protein
MSYKKLTLLPALVYATAVFGQGTSKSAHADIVNAQGEKIGTVKILPVKEGVKIVVKLLYRHQHGAAPKHRQGGHEPKRSTTS